MGKTYRDRKDHKLEPRLKAGKFYRNRRGERVGPMVAIDKYENTRYSFECDEWSFTLAGRVFPHCDTSFDLISEWVDPPPANKPETMGKG